MYKRYKKNNLFSPRTNIKQPLTLDGSILLRLCLGDILTQVWLEVVPHLALNLLLRTSIVTRFIAKIISMGQKIAHWYSHQVAIIACRISLVAATTFNMKPCLSKDTTHKAIHNVLTVTSTRIARQIVGPRTP